MYAKKWQIIARDDCSSVGDGLLQCVHGFCKNTVGIQWRRNLIETCGFRVRQKILHKLIDAASGVINGRE